MSRLAIAVLAQMQESARIACAHAARGGDAWHHDGLIVDAVANRVRQVAELAKHGFPRDEQGDYPGIPWTDLARARDFSTHHYSRLDPERLRRTMDEALPALLAELERLDIPEFNDEDDD